MIDEVKIQCFGCNKWEYLMIFDPELLIYFCPDCVANVGHEPPFTHEELLKLTNLKRKV
jgi:hypothetical protein